MSAFLLDSLVVATLVFGVPFVFCFGCDHKKSVRREPSFSSLLPTVVVGHEGYYILSVPGH